MRTLGLGLGLGLGCCAGWHGAAAAMLASVIANFPRAFRLVSTLELELELSGEVELVRVEVFRSLAAERKYRVTLWRHTMVQSVIGVDEASDQAELAEWQTLEDFTDLLDAKDTEFEADSLDAAEQRVLEALGRRANEAAWAKN